MQKTFVISDISWIDDVVESTGNINVNILKYNLLKTTLTHYAKQEDFQYLVFLNKHDSCFYLFDVRSDEVIYTLLNLKLCWPSYGTVESKDRSDSSITLPN